MIITDNKTPYNGTVVINGENVAGRLLEDVMFLADVVDGIPNLTTVRVDPDAADYFTNFNQEKWLQEIREYVADENEHLKTIDGDDVWVDSGAQTEIQSIEVESLGEYIQRYIETQTDLEDD